MVYFCTLKFILAIRNINMNKSLIALIGLMVFLLSFNACSDDENYFYSEEWRSHNERQVTEAIQDPTFKPLKSISENGSVYWKYVDFIPDLEIEETNLVGPPRFTDSVDVRYQGWYLDPDNKEIVFDTTEGINNGKYFRTCLNNVIDGWATILQTMEVGDQVEIVVPHRLGYGVSGSDYDYYTTQLVKPYTTLRFKIALLRIIEPVTPK